MKAIRQKSSSNILLSLYEFLFLSSGYSSGQDLLQTLDEEHERQSTQQYCDGLMSENRCGWDGSSEPMTMLTECGNS